MNRVQQRESEAVRNDSREYLTFTLGEEEYAIDILKVQEIRGYDQPTLIANTPPFIKGVINLRGIIVPILVEVNIAGEETKFGTTAEDAMLLVEEISKLENVRIRGLMTIAPFVENPEDNRLYFRKIKQLSVDITNKNIDNVSMEILSMGMTGDYEVAIEEGATMVRVGTGIFGARNYKKSNESH